MDWKVVRLWKREIYRKTGTRTGAGTRDRDVEMNTGERERGGREGVGEEKEGEVGVFLNWTVVRDRKREW